MKTLKMIEKSLKIHKQTKFRHNLSLCRFVIEPVILYDKFIDDLGLYENYLICIFMNIPIKMSKNEEYTGKNYIHCKVLDRLKDLSCIPGKILKAASVVRGTTSVP